MVLICCWISSGLGECSCVGDVVVKWYLWLSGIVIILLCCIDGG